MIIKHGELTTRRNIDIKKKKGERRRIYIPKTKLKEKKRHLIYNATWVL